jgi:Mrp family chromosome partitioning ATPase
VPNVETAVPEEFLMLRVTIEAQIQVPAQVVVTSATPSDGATYVALGLARAFAANGRRTALIDAANTQDAPSASPESATGLRSVELARNLHVMTLGKTALPAGAGSPKAVESLLETVRTHYDVAIIDAGPVLSSSAALEMARVASGVLLSVRLGRPARFADGEIMPALARVGARVLGVATTSHDADENAFLPTRDRGRTSMRNANTDRRTFDAPGVVPKAMAPR